MQMTKLPWGSWEAVGDQSEYVNQISTYAQQSVSLYVKWLGNGVNFRYLLDAFSK